MTSTGDQACPTMAELAAFCWGEGTRAARAAIVHHLAVCVTCRGRAAIIMEGCRSDRRQGDETPDD